MILIIERANGKIEIKDVSYVSYNNFLDGVLSYGINGDEGREEYYMDFKDVINWAIAEGPTKKKTTD